MIFFIVVVANKISSNDINRFRISIYSIIAVILLSFFISFISEAGLLKYLLEHQYLTALIILLVYVFLALSVIYEKYAELMLYAIYFIFIIIIWIITSSDMIKTLHLGNYTPDVLILDEKAKAIIPANFLDSNNTLKKPKILSNIGDEYYIELTTPDKKVLRLSIPKNLVLSEQVEIEEKQDKPKDIKNKEESNPK
ncbi:hypothetical protein [Helicobacter cappadocius]|uniref:Uncharacterized protein n=1 Tax=Helicobacter cappadocius TaxID=3063998 RepID=A0AA90PT25_9HELI|nr:MULTISPECIES: hypothetical protein [unclassified Helicobacter]MDO7252891.1 hypothetical protein [Helicobacter sp. faydin-H75]MDP2538934.1 hypothetical protein [Helicobacter sp. faydin-H76]